jgi:macrolide transport system ATP-binding/permease protein
MNRAKKDEDYKVLVLQNVGRKFKNGLEINALVDVNLSINRGDWICITGPSGAGKSTLLNILGCLDTPTSGTYFVDGTDTKNLTDKQLAGIRSRKIGFVFQSFHLLPHRTVIENVMLAEVYRKQSRENRRERALEALEKVGLSHRVEYFPSKLSGGERQRVAIARALMGSPSVLLCDEPTGNLDSHSSSQIVELLEDLNRQGITIVVVTHNQAVAEQIPIGVQLIDGKIENLKGNAVQRSPTISDLKNNNNKPVTPSGMSFLDLFYEGISSVFAKPGRMFLTILGIAIGLTALVATIGLTRTSANRIISQFDEFAATEIFLSARPGRSTGIVDPAAIPWDAPDRLQRLNGVAAAGTMSKVDVGDLLVSSSPINDPLGQRSFKLSVYSASPSLFRAVRAKLDSGMLPDQSHSIRGDLIAVLGPDAASRLRISHLNQLPAISIGDHVFVVAGIIKDVVRKPELLGAVIIPNGTARKHFGLKGPQTVVVETKIGATRLIANQAPLALRPDNARILKVEIPFDPQRLRENVKSDLNVLFLLLGGLSLIVGAIGIANITLVGVIERTGEIGLRRAIGATKAHITRQFLFESTSIGVLGGIIGTSVGILVVVGVSAYNTWTPVLDPAIPMLAPLIGGTIGLVSGTYPALRAASLQPVDALRR